MTAHESASSHQLNRREFVAASLAAVSVPLAASGLGVAAEGQPAAAKPAEITRKS